MPVTKVIFQYLLFLIISNSFAQENFLRIEVVPKKEMNRSSDYHLYQNDSLLFTQCHLKNNSHILHKLPKGNYKLKYDTVFGVDSIAFSFESDREFKKIILQTENPSRERLANTFSSVESLKNNEQITVEYGLSACFIHKKKKATILKENDQYYFIDYRHKRLITERRINRIIRHEKILKNLNFENTLHGYEVYVTCVEFFSLSKDEIQVFEKSVFCGMWSESSTIRNWIK